MLILPVLHVLLRIEHELLLFAAFWFILGAFDELVIDLFWLWLRLTNRARDAHLSELSEVCAPARRAAVLVPAWHEAEVIGHMVRHTLDAWPQQGWVLYVGCYRNDPETLAAALQGAGSDARVRLIVHECDGPTTKADCLNRIYEALSADEAHCMAPYASVILHDAEDMVHPAALSVIDRLLEQVDFVQLPVRPEPQKSSPWVAGHYSDEFTENHAKAMVVRSALGAAIPAAGVGCGFSRAALARLADERAERGELGPFAADSLTEDYELGLRVSRMGGGGRFVRLRDCGGELVATRAFFPATLETAVRQKSRWMHGIALQGWDRLGWSSRPVDLWMAIRDRRGPLTAFVLAVAYGLMVLEGILGLARLLGWGEAPLHGPLLRQMLVLSFVGLVWRALWRFGFTAGEYGLGEGWRAVLRLPVANLVAIMAGRRALFAYIRSLLGADLLWDKTHHPAHPVPDAARKKLP